MTLLEEIAALRKRVEQAKSQALEFRERPAAVVEFIQTQRMVSEFLQRLPRYWGEWGER